MTFFIAQFFIFLPTLSKHGSVSAADFGDVYKSCLAWEKLSFATRMKSSSDAWLCAIYMEAMQNVGYQNCSWDKKRDVRNWNSLSPEALAQSLINYARNNPGKWKYNTYGVMTHFAEKGFPCDLK